MIEPTGMCRHNDQSSLHDLNFTRINTIRASIPGMENIHVFSQSQMSSSNSRLVTHIQVNCGISI